MSQANVIRPANGLPQYVRSEFPAMFWNQETGVPVTVNSEAEIPAGYKPYHPASAPADAVKAPVIAAGKPTLNKAETVQHLSDGGIEHDPAASHKSLYELLLAGVKNALTEAKIAFDDTSTDAKALLGLFPSS